jgi:hypothetical protein
MEKNIFQEALDYFLLPWKQVAFWLYFVGIVIGFGGIGIWLCIYECAVSKEADMYKVSQNLGLYSMAIIAASIVDLNLSTSFKNLASLNILTVILLGVATVLFLLSYYIHSGYGMVPALLGIFISLTVWVLANAENEKLNDSKFYDKMRGEIHGRTWEQ